MDYMELSKKKRVAEAKSDLIGAIYGSELLELLEFGKTQTSGERDAWNAFEEGLKSVAGSTSVKKQNDVEIWFRTLGMRGKKPDSGLDSIQLCACVWRG